MTSSEPVDSAQPEFDPIRVDPVDPDPIEYTGEELDIPGKLSVILDKTQYITRLNYTQNDEGRISLTLETSNKPKKKK